MADFSHLMNVQTSLTKRTWPRSTTNVKSRASIFENAQRDAPGLPTFFTREKSKSLGKKKSPKDEQFDGFGDDHADVTPTKVNKRDVITARVSLFNQQNHCATCDRPVFHGPELTEVDGRRYHNWCFRCESCQAKLSNCTGNFRIENNKNFCHRCFDMLFHPQKQNYPMPNTEHLVEREQALTWDPTPAPSMLAGWQEKINAPAKNKPSNVRRGTAVQILDEEGFGFEDLESSPDSSDPFAHVGASDGFEIWRIEGDRAVRKSNRPAKDLPFDNVGMDAFRGVLYDGDIYVFLNSSTRQTGKRFAEIFYWVGKNAPVDAELALDDVLPQLRKALPRELGNVAARRIDQIQKGPFFQKFKDAYAAATTGKNFALTFKSGGFSGGKTETSLDELNEASYVFENRLIKVKLEDGTIIVGEVPCTADSITNDAVYLLETFGKLYQFNGIRCRPVERFEGRMKFQSLAAQIEKRVGAVRPPNLDFEAIMQTRNGSSDGERRFYEILAGQGPNWEPMTESETQHAIAEAHSTPRRESKYDGTKWQVRDLTIYEHSTSFFGGRNAAGPGRIRLDGRSG